MLSLFMLKVLRIDTETDRVTTFGKVSPEKNKYQGGTLASDGYVYAIPSNSDNILCIDTNERMHSLERPQRIGENDLSEDDAFTIGNIESTKKKRKDKWQGE